MLTTIRENKMEYIESLVWFSLWPIVIYTSYRVVLRNLKKFEEIQ